MIHQRREGTIKLAGKWFTLAEAPDYSIGLVRYDRNNWSQEEALCNNKCWSEGGGGSAQLIRSLTDGWSVGHHVSVAAVYRKANCWCGA